MTHEVVCSKCDDGGDCLPATEQYVLFCSRRFVVPVCASGKSYFKKVLLPRLPVWQNAKAFLSLRLNPRLLPSQHRSDPSRCPIQFCPPRNLRLALAIRSRGRTVEERSASYAPSSLTPSLSRFVFLKSEGIPNCALFPKVGKINQRQFEKT